MLRKLSFALLLSSVAGSMMCCESSGDSAGSSGFAGTDATFEASSDGNSLPDEAASDSGGTPSGMLLPVSQEAYLKASNTTGLTSFGVSVALSADGTTLAVGGDGDNSSATGIGGDQSDSAAGGSGAVYIFHRAGTTWSQDAYIKPSNTRAGASFGRSVALSADGNTLAVGSDGESSSTSGVDGSQADGGLDSAGAAYLFTRSGTTWAQTHYLKASKTAAEAFFGGRVSLSADGATLVVAARGEATSLTGINGDEADAAAGAAYQAGAAYVFALSGTTWSQQAFVKASNTAAGAQFGTDVKLSTDGNSLAVGAPFEDATANRSGAVYTFTRAGATWSQDAFVKASNPKVGSNFGTSVAFSSDASTLAVGASGEPSSAKGIGDPSDADTSATQAGAAYVFTRAGTTWSQQVYAKPSNNVVGEGGFFGSSIALAGDGSTLVVGAYSESSGATGIDGNQSDLSAAGAGAAYAFSRAGTTWSQVSYIKASNTRASAIFGLSVALSSNASTLVVGSPTETSNASGIDQSQAAAAGYGAAGAVYAFQ